MSGSVGLPAGFNLGYNLTSSALPTGQTTAGILGGGLSPMTVTGQGHDFVSLNDDLIALAAALANLTGPGGIAVGSALTAIDGASVTVPWYLPFAGGKLGYHLLQVNLDGGLHLTDAVTLTPQVQVTLTSNTGQTRTGNLGDSFSFTMPQSGPLKLSESLSLAGSQVSTNWGLGADLAGSVPLLQGDLLGKNFGPLADPSGTLFDSGTLANIISTGDFTVSSNSSVVPISSVTDAITIGGVTSATATLASTTAQAAGLLAPAPLVGSSFAGVTTLAASSGVNNGISTSTIATTLDTLPAGTFQGPAPVDSPIGGGAAAAVIAKAAASLATEPLAKGLANGSFGFTGLISSLESNGASAAPTEVAALSMRSVGVTQGGTATDSPATGSSSNASIGNQVAGYEFTTAQSGATPSVAEALPTASVGASTFPGRFGGSLLPNVLESPLTVGSFWNA